MASEEKKNLEAILKPVLKVHGFRKKGGTWWRHTDDFIQVVNIHGSQWSKRFYLNLGVYIREIGDKEFPAEYDCHVSHLAPSSPTTIAFFARLFLDV